MTIPINKQQIAKTTSEWSVQNPIVPEDVIGIEVTPSGINLFKRGNGTSVWSQLPYLGRGQKYAPDDHNHSATNITSGTLSVARGGTGRSTLTSGYFLRGNGTSAATLSSPAQMLSVIGAAASGHDHSKVNGYTVGTNSAKFKNCLASIATDGVMEVGSIIDFHEAEGNTDFNARLVAPRGELQVQTAVGGNIAFWKSGGYFILGPQSAGSSTHQLGASSHPWRCVFAQNGTIQTSDRKAKRDIGYDLDSYEGLFNSLKPTQYRFKNEKDGKFHLGFIAQDIEQSLTDNGLTLDDFAGVVKEKDEHEDERYSLNYSEMIALNTHMLQKALGKIEQLKSDVASLKEQLEQKEGDL